VASSVSENRCGEEGGSAVVGPPGDELRAPRGATEGRVADLALDAPRAAPAPLPAEGEGDRGRLRLPLVRLGVGFGGDD
jgi:hypothetical protein